MKTKRTGKFLAILLTLAMVIGMFPMTAFAEGERISGYKATSSNIKKNNEEGTVIGEFTQLNNTGTFEVGTFEDFSNAVNQINAAESGSFSIKLTDDITANNQITFAKNETTIYGQGHTLKLNNSVCFNTKNEGTILNFGVPDGTDVLEIDGQGLTRTTAMIACSNAVMNMYPGVIICNTNGGGAGGSGVFIYGTFNMYGGAITNCTSQGGVTSLGIGGAVSLHSGTFNMIDGVISDNSVAGYGYGAGVLVYADRGSDCTFNMRGGTISQNSNTGDTGWGGGICLMQEENTIAAFNMTGGTIENNTANVGGGIFNLNGIVNMTGGIIRNNAAKYCADDVLSQGGSCKLVNPSGFGTLASSGRSIDDWYIDGLGDGTLRWNQQVDPEGRGLDLDGDGQPETMPNPDGCYDLDGDGIYEIHKDDPYISKLDDPEQISANEAVPLKAAHSDVSEQTYTVTYTDGVDNEEIFRDQITTDLIAGDDTPVFNGTPYRNGYIFKGWNPEVEDTVTRTVIYTAQWNKRPSSGTTYYTLMYESNGGTEYKDEQYVRNTVVGLDKVPSRDDYTFTGWYADEALTTQIKEIKMTSNKTVYAGWGQSTVPDMLNGSDHFAYVIGYPNGNVGPTDNITRAEVATMFFRLLNENVRDANLTKVSSFGDVSEGAWYNNPVSTMEHLGIIKGRAPGLFAPEAEITRAEFAAICARFDTSVENGNNNFSDISNHWAEAEIQRAATLGWIQGCPDGTFQPDRYITRAEAMTMINRALCRIPETKSDLLSGMRVWQDNQPGAWYYLAVQEATNSHTFERKGKIYEHWLTLTEDPDWSKYQ